MPDLKPCPFCGVSFIKKEGRERGGDYYTYYEHPYNDCVIETVTIEDYQVKDWNRRAGEEDKHETD